MPTKQRLVLCRLGFVLLCMLPTLAVCLWIAGKSTASPVPHDDAAWLRELSGRLGLIVECVGSSQGDDEVMRLAGARLLDPETRAVLVQAAQVEARRTSAGWQIEARGAEIDAGQFARLAALLHERLLGVPAEDVPRGVLLARDVVLRDAQTVHTLSSLAARLQADAGGPQATIELALAGSPPDAPSTRLAIVRDRSSASPVTRWQLDTARQTLPCSLLAHGFPEIERLGSEAQFTGLISVSMEPGGPTGELAGALDGIDLDAVVTERFAHQLSGLARVKVELARFEGGKLADLRGTLEARGGALSPSLVTAVIDHLRLQPASELPADDTASIPFEQLAIGFALDGRLLRLSPLAPESATVLASAQGPLLVVERGHAVPAVNLLRALLPDNEYQVPATRQTDALVGLLPVPDLVPERTASRTNHTPTRLRSSGPAEAAPILRQPGLR